MRLDKSAPPKMNGRGRYDLIQARFLKEVADLWMEMDMGSRLKRVVAVTASMVFAIALAGTALAQSGVLGDYLHFGFGSFSPGDGSGNMSVQVIDSEGEILADSEHDIVPGASVDFDPQVSVSSDQHAYVFAELTNTSVLTGAGNDVGKLIDYQVDAGWRPLQAETDEGLADYSYTDEDGNVVDVYYREFNEEGASGSHDAFPLIQGGAVAYNGALTNDFQILDLDASDDSRKSSREQGVMKVQARMVSFDDFASAVDAYVGKVKALALSLKFPNTSSYLYRVGNLNAVRLDSLFSADGEIDSSAVELTVTDITPDVQTGEANGTVLYASAASGGASSATAGGTSGAGQNGSPFSPESAYADDSTSSMTAQVSEDASDWKNTTVKFSGSGVVSIAIGTADRTPVTVLLEVVDAWNVTTYTELKSNRTKNTVLLNNLTGAFAMPSGESISFPSVVVYGNGFELDVSAGKNTQQGIVSLAGTRLDNLVITGGEYSSYTGSYNTAYYTATVTTSGATPSYIDNCYISGCAMPLRVWGNVELTSTVLSGGCYSNLDIRNFGVVLNDCTTVNNRGFGITVYPGTSGSSTLTINGTLEQHNFISENTQMVSSAQSLKNLMFSNEFAAYQFMADGVKYVNAGIISMADNVGATNIFDNRVDKRNYAGRQTSISAFAISSTGYVYTMLAAGNELETDYQEPQYVPDQPRYRPHFSVDLDDQLIEGTDEAEKYCYYEDGMLKLKCTQADPVVLNVRKLVKIEKYSDNAAVFSVVCTDDSGNVITAQDDRLSFTKSGAYKLIYTVTDFGYADPFGHWVAAPMDYMFELMLDVQVVEASVPDARIEFTADPIAKWGLGGTTSDPDYFACCAVLEGLRITDYDAVGQSNVVFSGGGSVVPSNLAISGDASKWNMNGKNFNEAKTVDGIYYRYVGPARNKKAAYSIVVTYSYSGNNGTVVTASRKYSFNESDTGEVNIDQKTCLAPGTPITMSDGSQRPVEEIEIGDMVSTYSFFNGNRVVQPVIIVERDRCAWVRQITLKLADGRTLTIIGAQSFFDMDMREYFTIDSNNYEQCIGRSIMVECGDGISAIKIASVDYDDGPTDYYELITAHDFNYFANGALTVTPLMFNTNLFEVDEQYRYDCAKMREDIERYGLFTPDDFAGYVNEDEFDVLGGSYFKVALGKSLITWDYIYSTLDYYVERFQVRE